MTPAVVILGVAVAWAAAGTAGRASERAAVRRRLRPPQARREPDPLAVLGRTVQVGLDRLASRWRPARRGRGDAVSARRVGAAVLGLGAVVVSPMVGAAAVLVVVAPSLLRRRRRPAVQEAAAVMSLPDTIDLLAVAARAGLPAPAAVAAVAERAPPPWGPALLAVVGRNRRGERFAVALDDLTDVGGVADVGRPLRALLRSAVDDGAGLVTGLDRLAADARDLRRRRAEEAARRVPVRLLLPLVACSLPAFALLTIVPIVAGALGALDL